MSDGVVSLAERVLAPLPEIVERLEDALERAKSGEIRSMALAMETLGGCTTTVFAIGDGDRAHLVFALETLKLRLVFDRELLAAIEEEG